MIKREPFMTGKCSSDLIARLNIYSEPGRGERQRERQTERDEPMQERESVLINLKSLP